MAVFYDTHAHLGRREFAEDLPQVIARAEAAGIGRIITIGTDQASSERVTRRGGHPRGGSKSRGSPQRPSLALFSVSVRNCGVFLD